ncbi:agmatine deiminase family protein [Mucilaginibacter antarcticus]|uniref:agmatine deiminase family protein n=1 Tax=Mucilaginibacter antarcticus TaxID=1855725 RepID=UPI003632034A
MAYPKGFSNEYEILVEFYDRLIELIPRDIKLFVITNTRKTERELKARFKHKPNVDTLVINYFDEIWLRDCMGVFAGDKIYKFNYSPNYCTLSKETNYYRYLNKLTKQALTEAFTSQIIEVPLNIDGGNFVHNTEMVFMTEKVYEDNPGKDVESIIKQYTGLDAIVVGRNYYDVIGHTDGYMAFKDKDTVFISEYPQLSHLKRDVDYVNMLKSVAVNNGLKVLPIFDNPADEPIQCACKNKKTRSCLFSARGVYVNYIRFNECIIMPEYSEPNNSPTDYNWMNKQWLESQGFDVLTINCDALAKFGGSLHCISFQA